MTNILYSDSTFRCELCDFESDDTSSVVGHYKFQHKGSTSKTKTQKKGGGEGGAKRERGAKRSLTYEA